MAALQAQLSALTTQLNNLQGTSSSFIQTVQFRCELCGQNNHDTTECFLLGTSGTEHVNYMGTPPQGNNAYSNTYYSGWEHYPNFSWSTNIAGGQVRFQEYLEFQQDPFDSLERKMDKMIHSLDSPLVSEEEERFKSFESKIEKMLVALDAKMERQEENQRRMFASQDAKFDQIVKNHATSIHNLEIQVSQLAIALSSNDAGSLPSITEANPREQFKAITFIMGQEEQDRMEKIESSNEVSQEKEKKQEEELHDANLKNELWPNKLNLGGVEQDDEPLHLLLTPSERPSWEKGDVQKGEWTLEFNDEAVRFHSPEALKHRAEWEPTSREVAPGSLRSLSMLPVGLKHPFDNG